MDSMRTPPPWRDVQASESAPILEYDPTRAAVLEPAQAVPRKNVVPADLAEECVLCFFHDAIAALAADGTLTQVTALRTEMSPQPVYEFRESGRRVTLVHPGLGAPMAAAFMEEMIALGCRRFIACGGAGVLRSDIAVGHLVVPTAAVRDEGDFVSLLRAVAGDDADARGGRRHPERPRRA